MESPSSAPPILGSTLLALAETHAPKTQTNANHPPPASSGSASIDKAALEGGFRYGEISSIAGAKGLGKTLLTYHVTCSHLLASSSGEIALIDTTGSFSPLHLRDVLIYRLRAHAQQLNIQHSGYMYEKPTAGEDDAFVEEATKMLDRVKVMRVFDLAGVAEAVGEVGEMIERVVERSEIRSDEAKANQRLGSEVGDSEAESSEEDNEPVAPATQGPSSSNDQGKIGVIIIDSMTQVVSAIMNKSQTQGHALLVSFMRSLQLLTARHHICTLLTNVAVGLTFSTNRSYGRPPVEDASIFSSTMGRPALGKTFAYLIDTSIFLSLVPKALDDAWIEFGDGRENETAQKVVVMEVLKDRCGTRQGRWAALEIIDSVKLAPYLT